MVLIRNDLHGVVVALDLARTVFQRIRLNYVWALAYNVFGVPTAAGMVSLSFLNSRSSSDPQT